MIDVIQKINFRDFPGGTVVKNPPSNAGDTGSIPGQGTRSHMHAATKSSHATTKEPIGCNQGAHVPQLKELVTLN